jgi:hypothetical protein
MKITAVLLVPCVLSLSQNTSRRAFIDKSVLGVLSSTSFIFIEQANALTPSLVPLSSIEPAIAATNPSLISLRQDLVQARHQLDPVPELIKKEQWDSVRAILISPPLSDCWTKSTRPLLQLYAEVLGDTGGDELAALEAREDITSRLRYLDMAVYNNVFNPIATQGTIGASKELVRSYYEDPINEYKASIAALDEVIALSDGVK